MENITQTTITTTTTTPPKSSSSPEEHETETTRTQTTTKALTFSNGVLKRHHPHNHHHHPVSAVNHLQLAAVVTYKECLKNHAAALGGHALDGCGEFMPAPTATSADPASIKCAACGCHRNFHRREPAEDPLISAAIEFQSHNRHQPPPPPPLNRSPNSASPPPISSSYYPHHHHHHHRSAPHMLLALSGAGIAAPPESTAAPVFNSASPRKRFRTKFSQDQKEKMLKFAEKVGWKIQKRDEDLIQEFCNDVGVDRGVLKVWMHNNKNTFAKRENNNNHGSANGVGSRSIMEEDSNINNNGNDNNNNNSDDGGVNGNDVGANVGANGSSSSS